MRLGTEAEVGDDADAATAALAMHAKERREANMTGCAYEALSLAGNLIN